MKTANTKTDPRDERIAALEKQLAEAKAEIEMLSPRDPASKEMVARRRAEARHIRVQADFARLVREDAEAAAVALAEGEKVGDGLRMIQALDSDQLIAWLRRTPHAVECALRAHPNPTTLEVDLVEDTDLPRYVKITSPFGAGTEEIRLDAETAAHLVAHGVPVRAPSYVTKPPEPHVLPGINMLAGSSTIYPLDAWRARLDVDRQSLDLAERGDLVAADLGATFSRGQLTARLAHERAERAVAAMRR